MGRRIAFGGAWLGSLRSWDALDYDVQQVA
jgi:hypothetical protein